MLEERLRLDRAPPFGSFQLIGTDDLWLMKEAIVEHGGYRIRVRTRGPAGGPHALVLPGMGDTEVTLASQIRTPRYLRYFLLGSRRRDDERFVQRLMRRDRSATAKALSMRAIVWANQPSRWRRLLLLPVPGGEQLGFTLREKVATLAVPTLVLW